MNPARLSAVLFHAVETAKFQTRQAGSFFRRQARAHELVGVTRDVEGQFLVHAIVETPAAKKGTIEENERASTCQTSSDVVFKAAAMAEVRRFHPSVSSRKRRRPAGVRL